MPVLMKIGKELKRFRRRLKALTVSKAEKAARPVEGDSLRFVLHAPFGSPFQECSQVAPNSINWVIPDIGMGSGGHLNIFRMIANLEKLGWHCRIAVMHPCKFPDAIAAKTFIADNFLNLAAEVHVDAREMPPATFTFASSWETAYLVRDFLSTAHRCYFVQDYEPWFFPAGERAALAEHTYRMGLLGVASGGWLKETLSSVYGMTVVPIGFSYDKGRYRPLSRHSSRDKKRVFFYGRPSTPRRGFDLGVLVLAELCRQLDHVEVVIAGWDISGLRLPFEHTSAGIAALDDLPQLYSDCDAALVLSFTNLSLLPLELMACGCPVVSNRGANVEWLLNKDVAVLCDATVESLCAGLVSALTDEKLRRRLIENGLALALGTDWESHARTLSDALLSLEPAALVRPCQE